MDEQGRFWEEYEWCEDDLYEEDNYKKVCSWDEIYWKCGLCIYKPEELQCELDALMEGGCKQNYDLIPFADDGDGGVCVLVDNQYVALIDSEGGAGYIAASVDDFINILLWYKYIPITKKYLMVLRNLQKIIKEMNTVRIHRRLLMNLYNLNTLIWITEWCMKNS